MASLKTFFLKLGRRGARLRLPWFSILIGLCGLSATLIFSNSIKVREHDHIRRTIAAEAEAVSRSIETAVTSHAESLVRLTKRWEFRKPSTFEWEADAKTVASSHGFEAIEWLDSSLRTRWSVYASGKKSIDTASALEAPLEKALRQSRENRTPTVTRAIDLPGGAAGVLIYVPVFVGPNSEKFDGFICGVLNLQTLIGGLLDVTLWRRYDLEVVEGNKPIYTRPGAQEMTKQEWAQETDLKFYGVDWRGSLWRVRLWPTSSWLDEMDHSIDETVLAAGIALTGLFALFTHFFALARSHASQLEIANVALRNEIGERVKAQTALADFTAMIIHDVRSPLGNVISIVTMLKDGLLGPINAEQAKWLDKADHAGRTTVDLISDFLDVSRLESGRIDLRKESLNLRQLIEADIETHALAAREKGIVLKNEVDDAFPRIDADPRRLEQVLNNLIGNALKFTPEGGEVVLSAAWNEKEIAISVGDTGIGIPADEIGRIFEKYKQTTSGATSKQKGTGLGLIICKMIVESHGGTIRAESEAGNGTTFTFTLPSVRTHDGDFFRKGEWDVETIEAAAGAKSTQPRGNPNS